MSSQSSAALRRRAQWRDWFWGYFFIAPSLAMFVAFALYPLSSSIVMSFQRVGLTPGTNQWVGIGNYQKMVQNRVFGEVLRNTIAYALGIVPVGTALALFLSVLIFQLRSVPGNIFKAAYYLPSVASGIALSFIWLYIYHPAFGLANYLLSLVGLEPMRWLANPKTALWSIVFMYHATSWGSSYVSTLDGASCYRQFLGITLPLLRPILTYVVIMSTIGSLRIFNQIFLMTEGGPGWVTTNLVYHVYTTAFQNLDFGLGSAQVMILLVVTISLAVIQYRYLALDVEY